MSAVRDGFGMSEGEAPITFPVCWPEAKSRIVPVPSGHLVEFRASEPFDLCFSTSPSVKGDGGEKYFSANHINGMWGYGYSPMTEDGVLRTIFVFWRFRDRTEISRLLICPPASDVIWNPMSDMQSQADHAVLANDVGTVAQVRRAWGKLVSKYDCYLSITPNFSGPADRRVVLSHFEIEWVSESICFKFHPEDTQLFVAGKDWARWELCRDGIAIAVEIEIQENGISFRCQPFCVLAANSFIRVWPFVDDRSFHEISAGTRWDGMSWEVGEFGFSYHLTTGGQFVGTNSLARFFEKGEWRHGLELEFESLRGLETHTSVFSPGYFEWDGGVDLELSFGCGEQVGSVRRENQLAKMTLPAAIESGVDLYLARRGHGNTVIAGFPWFLDWGRDSLIFVRGLIAFGRLEVASEILRLFGRLESRGTLPNHLRGNEVPSRETSDAPLWFVVAAGELILQDQSWAEMDCGERSLRDVVDSILKNYVDGTETGIALDGASGLVFSPSHFTWMDTANPAGTPREGYPIEIQALWIASCRVGMQLGLSGDWESWCERAVSSLERYWSEDVGFFSDCLHAESGQSATEARGDDHLRPNQWLLFGLGALPPDDRHHRMLEESFVLILPGMARSLAPRPVDFALPIFGPDGMLNDSHSPYWGRYAGNENTRRKPAYHNGTAWGLCFPWYCEALAVSGARGKDAARKLLASSFEPFRQGCFGQLPEVVWGDFPHLSVGCGAQAWSISEWGRVWRAVSDCKMGPCTL